MKWDKPERIKSDTCDTAEALAKTENPKLETRNSNLSLLKKLASQTAVYGLSSILGRLLNYLLVPLYTRVFDAAEYGVVTQLYAYVTFLNVLFTYGLETAFFRFSQTEADRKKVYSTGLWSLLLTSLLGAGAIIFAAGALSGGLSGGTRTEDYPLYIACFAAVLAFDAVSTLPFARLRLQNRAVRFVTIRLISILLNVGLNCFFLLYCPYALQQDPNSFCGRFYDPSFGVGYVFVINVVTSGLTVLLLLPELLPLRWGFDSELWKKMVRYGLPLMVAGFAGMINETIDRILLPVLTRDPSTAMEQLGIYGACYKLSILMTLFVQTFRYAAEPFFFTQSGREDAPRLYATVMHYFVLAGSLIFLGVQLYMDWIQEFIGPGFRSGLVVVPILLLANLCLGVYLNLSFWYKITGHTRWGAWFSVFGAVVTLALNFLLIPLFGYLGAAWATLACYASMMAVSYYYGQRYYPVPYDLRSFALLLSSALLVFFVGQWLSGMHLPKWQSTLLNSALLLLWIAFAAVYEHRKKLPLSKFWIR